MASSRTRAPAARTTSPAMAHMEAVSLPHARSACYPCRPAGSPGGPPPGERAVSTAAPTTQAPILVAPTYGYQGPDGQPYHPTAREVLREWLDAVDVRQPARRLPALFFVFHVLAAAVGSISIWNSTW